METGRPVLFREFAKQTDLKQLVRVSMKRAGEGDSYDETFLQALLHRCPNILPIHEYFTGGTELLSLGREISIDVGGGKIRSLDNLFVTSDGRIVMVEAKLWRNPEALRMVVTQSLEYGRVLTAMNVVQLQAAIHSSGNEGRVLREGESIEDYVARVNDERGLVGYNPTRFATQLEMSLASGDSLLLIVGDGIHPSVERFVNWFETRAQLPFSFGLVQVEMFRDPSSGTFAAVPRTLLRTREVTRHVVAVSIRTPKGIEAEYKIEAQLPAAETGAPLVRSGGSATSKEQMTVERLLAGVTELAPDDRETMRALLDGLRGLDLQSRSTSTLLAFFDPLEGAEGCNVDLISIQLDARARVYAGWVMPSLAKLGLSDDIAERFRTELNKIAPFWAPDRLRVSSGGSSVPLAELKGRISELLAAIRHGRDEIRAAFASTE